jgi:hypothetical protein
MYINPTGHIVTAWDKEHCTPEEVERLEELTTIAESGGNVTEAHSEAEGIREHYRDDDEYGTGDGNTVHHLGFIIQFIGLEMIQRLNKGMNHL